MWLPGKFSKFLLLQEKYSCISFLVILPRERSCWKMTSQMIEVLMGFPKLMSAAGLESPSLLLKKEFEGILVRWG